MPDDLRSGPHHSGSLIAAYEAIARASHAMLAAARADNWQRVGALEDECRELIAALKQSAARAQLGRMEQQRRVQLLRAILADDAEIRARAEPWLQQLESLWSSKPPGRGTHR